MTVTQAKSRTKSRPKRNSSSSTKTFVTNGVDHGQRRKIIVEQLLLDIFQGRLKAGERLVITTLAERFGVSQSPIREALVALEGIGIIDSEPNRGAVVRRVTESDVKEVCQVRRALECTAVRLACGRTDLTQLQELADAFRKVAQYKTVAVSARHRKAVKRRQANLQKQIDSARKLDSFLHDLIADSCGNRFLKQELGRLKLLFRSFRDVSWDQRSSESDVARFAEEAGEHLAIVEAMLEGNTKAASKAMSRHIRQGVKYWSRGLSK